MADCRSADADNRRRLKECALLCLIGGRLPRCSIGLRGGREGFCLIGYVPDLSLGGGESGWMGSGKKDQKDKTGKGVAVASAVGTTSEWVRLRRMESVDCGPLSARFLENGGFKLFPQLLRNDRQNPNGQAFPSRPRGSTPRAAVTCEPVANGRSSTRESGSGCDLFFRVCRSDALWSLAAVPGCSG